MIGVAVTGASGPVIGVRLMEVLLDMGEDVAAVVSSAAWAVMAHEMACEKTGPTPVRDMLVNRGRARNLDRFIEFGPKDFYSPLASGSARWEGIVVAPCSMKSLAAIANGLADSLITRACDVALKEGRACILVPRETPLNLIHIENMKQAVLAGARIIPPVPGFYTHPSTIDDVVDFIVGKILGALGKPHKLVAEWGKAQ